MGKFTTEFPYCTGAIKRHERNALQGPRRYGLGFRNECRMEAQDPPGLVTELCMIIGGMVRFTYFSFRSAL